LCLQRDSTRIEEAISVECELLIEAIKARKLKLFEFLNKEREFKFKQLKDHVSSHTMRLQKTTGLIHFCIEALKESDPVSFLHVNLLTPPLSPII